MKNTPLNLMRFLRREFPTNFAVKLRWLDHLDDNAIADCALYEPRKRRPYFEICLSRDKMGPFLETWWIVREAIMHEYAHALAWTPAHKNLQDHGPLWGVAYSMLYEKTLKAFPTR